MKYRSVVWTNPFLLALMFFSLNALTHGILFRMFWWMLVAILFAPVLIGFILQWQLRRQSRSRTASSPSRPPRDKTVIDVEGSVVDD